MAITTQQLEKIFEEGYCLVDLLPYIEHNGQAFVLSDGSFGQIWKVESNETEGKDEQYLSSLSSKLENLLNRIPMANLACQIILTNHRGINERLRVYEEFKENGSALSIFSQGKLSHIKGASEGFFGFKANEMTPRKVDIYLTLRFFPDWLYPSFWQKTMNVLQGKESIKQKIYNEMGM